MNNIVSKSTARFFGEETPLKEAAEHGGRTYEERPQQVEMAKAIAAAVEKGKHLCVEAPTGVGKSFAYLVPALYYAHFSEKRVVASTHTISLQEQLIHKDLKILKNILPCDFNAVLAKGRENYVCLRRLHAAHGNPREFLFTDGAMEEVIRIKDWTTTETDGSKSEMNPLPEGRIWSQVNCEPGNCLNAKCPFFSKCFYMEMKKNMGMADIIVTNHSLFFVDMAMKAEDNKFRQTSEGILPQYAVVVLDEAHTIEESASTHLGLRVSSAGFFRTCNRLYNTDKNRGLLFEPKYSEAREAVKKLKSRAETFFDRLTDWVDDQKESPLRYNTPGHIPHILHGELCAVDAELKIILDIETNPEKKQEIIALKEQLYEYAVAMHTFLDMSEPGFVYWWEIRRFDDDRRILSLHGAPVEVDKLLNPLLFHQNFTTIMTSATLAVEHSLSYFLKRIGAEGTDELVLTSPFDYSEQVELYVPLDMPHPKKHSDFLPKCCEYIEQFVTQTKGRALVLFTSYSMMQDVANEMETFFTEGHIDLIMQGKELSRNAMLQAFTEHPSCVLFGTSSFWTGIDIPGEALSNVIIVKMPFSVPSYPLTSARMECIEYYGGNSFMDYSLPEAILKFRQGFGRLIRSKTDKGIVVILDVRVLQSRWGEKFLDSIPPCTRKVF